MATNRGGDLVKSGYYWNLEKWDATFVEAPAGELPGGPGEVYRRIPVALLLLAAPLMGALFVIFLPFIGIAILLQHIGRAAMQAAGDTLERVLGSLGLAWRPGLAFLTSKAGGKRSTGARTVHAQREAPEKEKRRER